LRKLIWDPISPHLEGEERVFLSLDGFLAIVPFDALPDGDGFLLERYLFSRLPDLTWALAAAKSSGKGLLALGGASYGPLKSDEKGFKPWGPLPATESEARQVEALFRVTFPSVTSQVLVGDDATEGRVRTSISGNSVVHLATHGFFQPDLGMKDENLAATAASRVAVESPGLMAGIVLAGANKQQLSTPKDDGYFTADEFCTLDLQACRLLTLSACESGRGKSIPGEGLMSMTRAAKQAGAAGILSSLWEVNDFFTKALMESFYTHYWSGTGNAAEALRDAKLEMLREHQAKYQAPHPEYWAAFVYHGR
jgi:CHAT domain-containing protein